MDTESENITPPSSPILGYSGAKDHQSLAGSGLVFCLRCKGQPRIGGADHSFSPNGYILRRELITSLGLLSTPDNLGMDHSLSLYSLFGRKWDPTDVIQLKKLVAVCRKKIASLEILADPVYSYNYNGCGTHNNSYQRLQQQEQDDLSNVEPWSLRKDVCLFLNFVVSRRNYFRKTLSNMQFNELFEGLKKSLGKAESWSPALKAHCGYRDGNDCTSASYHTFHLQLELRWSIFVLYGADPSSVQWILEDLIFLAWYKYTQEGDVNLSLCDKQPFNCWCVKEIWTMLRLLLEALQKNFWEAYAQGMKTFMSSSKSKSDIFFPVWLTVYIAELGDYNLSGVFAPKQDMLEGNNGYPFINDILKEWAGRGGKSADIMKLVLKLLPYWGFDLDVVVLFWNNFFPKLDKNLEVISSSLTQYDSVDNWVRLIEGLISDNDCLSNTEDNTTNGNFLSFLRLLVGHVQICSPKDWRKLKCNIGMKLNRSNVGVYGEVGLVRVSTVYLTLAYFTSDSLSMSERLKEILKFAKSTPGRQKIELRAKAAMTLILLKKSQDIRKVDITKTFMDMITALMSQQDASKKEMIMVYWDLLDSLPPPSTPDFCELSLSRDCLISPNLTMWLFSCGSNYATRALRVLNKLTLWIITSKTSNSLLFDSQERDDISANISERTFKLITQSVIINANRTLTTDVEPLANLAADLTVLCKGNDAYTRNLDHFALNERTCPEVSQYYVSRLFSHRLSFDNNISDLKWCQIWIRLNALDCNSPDELNVKVLGPGFQSASNEALLKRFCSTSDQWSRGDTQTILHPLVVLCKAAVGTTFADNPNVISSITTACAVVLKHVKFEKLYIKGDSLSAAHKILETLVPALVGTPPWDKLPQQVVHSLRKHLFDIFETITSYPSSIFDPYLHRKVQDIVTFSILGFVGGREQIDDEHPGIKIMTYANSGTNQMEAFGTVLNNCIANLCKASKDAKLTQRFVMAVTGLKQKKLTSAVMKFLPGILTIFVSSTSPDISNACINIVIYCCTFGLTPLKLCLLEAFGKSMEADFAFRSRRFYELCTSLNKCTRPQVRTFLRVDLLPLLDHHVDLCESRRGIGIDNALRQPLQKLKHEIKLLDAQRTT